MTAGKLQIEIVGGQLNLDPLAVDTCAGREFAPPMRRSQTHEHRLPRYWCADGLEPYPPAYLSPPEVVHLQVWASPLSSLSKYTSKMDQPHENERQSFILRRARAPTTHAAVFIENNAVVPSPAGTSASVYIDSLDRFGSVVEARKQDELT